MLPNLFWAPTNGPLAYFYRRKGQFFVHRQDHFCHAVPPKNVGSGWPALAKCSLLLASGRIAGDGAVQKVLKS